VFVVAVPAVAGVLCGVIVIGFALKYGEPGPMGWRVAKDEGDSSPQEPD